MLESKILHNWITERVMGPHADVSFSKIALNQCSRSWFK